MQPKVSLVGCEGYEQSEVDSAVTEAVNLLGGIKKYAKKGQRILLKPNLLSAVKPEKFVTTHPAVVKAVAKLVQSAGATPVIGDSPSGLFNKQSLKRVYKATGMTEAAEEVGAELNYETGYQIVSNNGMSFLKAIEVSDYITQADAVISLPKLKTHSFMQYTGAIKNMFGAIPGVVKVAYHAKLETPEEFADMLVDLVKLTQPDLAIMDGVWGMEGNGPSQGEPRKVGAILASDDSITLDVATLSLVGWNPKAVPDVAAAVTAGHTSGKIGDIEIVGDELSDYTIPDFKAPTTAKNSLMGRIMWKIAPTVSQRLIAYPLVKSNCVACGVCRQSCPAEAMTIEDKAVVDLGKCIRCYCCHETCPHNALELKTPLLGRLIK